MSARIDAAARVLQHWESHGPLDWTVVAAEAIANADAAEASDVENLAVAAQELVDALSTTTVAGPMHVVPSADHLREPYRNLREILARRADQ